MKPTKFETVFMNLFVDRIPSPLGTLLVVTDSESLCALEFEDREARLMDGLQRRYDRVSLTSTQNPFGLSQQVQAYLEGELDSLQSVPLNPGGTAFQQAVWTALRQIPAGTTASYQDLAIRIGKPAACRAVGMANGRNPIAIAIPCHRIVGSNGKLTGYAGGLERKRWLLEHEGIQLTDSASASQRSQTPCTVTS